MNELTTINSNIHLVCVLRRHTEGYFSESQIESVSQSLSASAKSLRRFVEQINAENTKSPQKKEEGDKPDPSSPDSKSTVAAKGEASYQDALKGFTKYDSTNVDTDEYLLKRSAYDSVRRRYPDNLKDLLRDQRVEAMKAINNVAFTYYTIQVVAYVTLSDGRTVDVKSKAHHRLQKPSEKILKDTLTNFFKAKIVENAEKSSTDNDSQE